MKVYITFFLIVVNCFSINSQYTETINSNRPGLSHGAFSIGKNVLQFELGYKNSNYENRYYNNSKILENKISYTIRYGFLNNKLEAFLDGSYNENKVTDNIKNNSYNNSFLGKQTLGFKFLVFDPFKNKKWHSVNLLSWKKNRNIKLTDFIPAFSVYTGLNYIPEKANNYDDPFSIFKKGTAFEINEKPVNPKVGLITQNHFLGKWVLVNNISLDRLGTSYSILNLITTLTHNYKNPRWSSFLEFETFKNDIYSDNYYKFGTAYLFNNDLQIDSSFGFNSKKTPSNFYVGLGISTRFDWYEDELPVNRKEKKALKKERKKNTKKTKKDYKLIKKQDKINKRFDRKESRLIKKSNRKNQK
jgi:hypothetical protein